jgi:hypothetical protein
MAVLGAPTAPVARPVARPAAPLMPPARQPTAATPSLVTTLVPPSHPMDLETPTAPFMPPGAPGVASFTQPEPKLEPEAEAAPEFEVPRELAAHPAEAPAADASALATAMASFRPHAAPSPEAAARVAASRPSESARPPRDPAGVTPGPMARPIIAASSTSIAPATAERSWGRILLLVALWTIAAVGVAMAYLSTR